MLERSFHSQRHVGQDVNGLDGCGCTGVCIGTSISTGKFGAIVAAKTQQYNDSGSSR